jgi:hypothetical protein
MPCAGSGPSRRPITMTRSGHRRPS